MRQLAKYECAGWPNWMRAYTEEQYEKIEFDMWADSASWKKVFDGEISVKKAMMSKGFGFKGPKLKAMMNMGGFERSIAIMVEMDGVTV